MTDPIITCLAETDGLSGVRLRCSRPFGHVGGHATAGGIRWDTPHVGRYVWVCDSRCPCKTRSASSTFKIIDPYRVAGAPNA